MKVLKLAIFASLALATVSVSAAVKDRHLITYYSDASKTTIVGITMTTCKAATISDGETTPYFDIVSEECSTGGGDFDWVEWDQYCVDNPLSPFC